MGKKDTCDTCGYFDDAIGCCKRHAPIAVVTHDPNYPETEWPHVAHSDYCGDWGPIVAN